MNQTDAQRFVEWLKESEPSIYGALMAEFRDVCPAPATDDETEYFTL